MSQNIYISQIKDIIKRFIDKTAKTIGCNPNEVALMIYTENDLGFPKFKILYNHKSYKDIEFSALTTIVEKFIYRNMKFDIDKESPKNIQKFILKCAKDHKILENINVLTYTIEYSENDLHAFMFKNDEKKEIEIEYILQTNKINENEQR